MAVDDPRKAQGFASDGKDGVVGRGSSLGSHDYGCLGGHGTTNSGRGSRVDRRGDGDDDSYHGSSFSGRISEDFDRGKVHESDSSCDVSKNSNNSVGGRKNRDGVMVVTGGAAPAMRTGDNTMKSLQYRDIGLDASFRRGPGRKSSASSIVRKNKDMDMYRYKEELKFYMETLRKRLAIIDIITVKDVVILRSDTCLAAAFCRVTNKLLAFLNESRSELIEYLFYNKYKECLMIVVSSGGTDGSASSSCYELKIQCISRKKKNHRHQIFQDEDLSWPGFLQVDAINDVILIKNERAYQIFDLKNYLFKYEFSVTNVETLLCRPQIFLVRYSLSDGKLPLEFKSTKTGETLISMKCNITEGEKVECVDLIQEKLLIEQSNKKLQVLDLIRLKQKEVEIGDFQLELLYGRNMFLSFQHNSTEVRDTNGNIVWNLERHALYKINSIEGNVCVTQEEDMIICTSRSEGITMESVNISCIDSGRLLLSIDPNAKVTALCFNNDLSELYVGTESGKALVWSI